MKKPANTPGGISSLGRPLRPGWKLASHSRLAAAPCEQARCEAVCSHEGLGLISNLGWIQAALLVCKW